MVANLLLMPEKDIVGNRWSKEEILIYHKSYATHGPDFKHILNDLIEEDFTSRTYDNVKAMHALVSQLGDDLTEEEVVD